jgi:hypothetical protein
MIFKDAEEAIEANINAGGLDHSWLEGFYLNPARAYFGADIAITEQHDR